MKTGRDQPTLNEVIRNCRCCHIYCTAFTMSRCVRGGGGDDTNSLFIYCTTLTVSMETYIMFTCVWGGGGVRSGGGGGGGMIQIHICFQL
jgi:hypothetical protein